MVTRVHYKRKHTYRTKSNKTRLFRTPGTIQFNLTFNIK